MTLRELVFKNRGLLLLPAAAVLVWFGRPTGRSALIGIVVAVLGEALRIWAVGYSGVTTRADIVTAPTLVTAGPYAEIRNPLYVGNGIIAIGFWIAFAGAAGAAIKIGMLMVVLVLIVGVYALIIPLEENYLAQTFGESFERYRRAVPSIVPMGIKLQPADRHGKWVIGVIARAEVITLALFVAMVSAVLLRLRFQAS